MNVKTFRGRTMNEALAQVRRGMGAGAVIVFTRTVRGKGFMGLLGRQVVEIGAVPDREVANLRDGARHETPKPKRATVRLEQVYHAAAVQPAEGQELGKIRRELSLMRESVENAMRAGCAADVSELPGPLVEMYLGLVRQEVCRQTAARLLKEVASEITAGRVPEPLSLGEMVARKLSGLITVSGAVRVERTGRSRVVALVGPTGVGKTTTVAKLAGEFSVCQGRKVGLITIDTYRIAAVQQLKTIADIVGVPLKTVLTTEELQAALADFRDKDMVIIDTAGRGQRDEFKMNELGAFVQAAHPDETHLVLAATARPKNLREVLGRFSQVGVDRLVLSKVDEAEGIGAAFTVAMESRLPVSYVTNGQDIPEDIEVADAVRLGRMVAHGALLKGANAEPAGVLGEVGA